MKKINKKNLIITISVITVLIIAIIVVILVNNKKDKNENKINGEIEVGEFETQIDMKNTENSEIREDGMKINKSDKIAKGIEYNDLLIKDIRIESTGDMAVFNASIENNLGKDIEGYVIFLTFLDNDGKVIDKVETFFPDIQDGETGYISATTPKDIATAKDIKIERQNI